LSSYLDKKGVSHFVAVVTFCAKRNKRYVAYTLNGFDDQERNLTFVKTDFQVLKFKFYALTSLQTIISSDLNKLKNNILQAFRSVPGCTCMCKRGIIQGLY